MPTFPEIVGGTFGPLKAAKAGPFKVGTGGTRYVAIFDVTGGTSTTTTTDTSVTTQVFFGTSGGEGIIWDNAGSNPGTSSDPFYPGDGYVTQTAYVDLTGGTHGTDTQTFTYAGPNQVGTVFSTAFLLATETILTTFINTNTNRYALQEVTIWKSTNTGSTWAEMDAAHAPTLSFFYNQFSACFDQNTGTNIHVIFTDTNHKLTHISYDANADLWGSPTEGPAPQTPSIGNQKFVTMSMGCIHQPSGNHVAVIVQDLVSSGTQVLDAIQYAVGGASWGGYQPMGTGTVPTGSWVPSAIICGSNDLVTTLAESMPASTNTYIRLWQQAISSGGLPGAQAEIIIGESVGGEIAAPYPADLCWNTADNKVTGVFFLQGFDSQTVYYISGVSADPVSFTTSSFAAATGAFFVEDIACAVNAGGTYVLWPSPLADFSGVVFFYNTNLGPSAVIGTSTDYPEQTFSLDAAGFSASLALCWQDGVTSQENYWEIFPNAFVGHRMMPQYIKRFNAPGH